MDELGERVAMCGEFWGEGRAMYRSYIASRELVGKG
jgi:hypothetical protein